MKRTTNHITMADAELIAMVAGYYNGSLKDIEFYRDLGYPDLEEMAKEHLAHWEKRLHELIFYPIGGDVNA